MDVRTIREGLGLSQRDLAERLGVSQSLVAQWERGTSNPTEQQKASVWTLQQRAKKVVRLDPYPSAPPGGPKDSRGAEERLAWVNARNAAIRAGAGSR